MIVFSTKLASGARFTVCPPAEPEGQTFAQSASNPTSFHRRHGITKPLCPMRKRSYQRKERP